MHVEIRTWEGENVMRVILFFDWISIIRGGHVAPDSLFAFFFFFSGVLSDFFVSL